MTPDGTRITDDMAFCAYVLKSAGLALIPGRAFSMPDYFRLSYAYSDAELSNGLSRLRSATDALYGPNGN